MGKNSTQPDTQIQGMVYNSKLFGVNTFTVEKYGPYNGVQSLGKFGCCNFSLAHTLCWCYNRPAFDTPNNADNGPFMDHLRELARSIEVLGYHDD